MLPTPGGKLFSSIFKQSLDAIAANARGLTPPWDAQALDDEAYLLMLRSYPGHRQSGHDDSFNAAEATLMRYRISGRGRVAKLA